MPRDVFISYRHEDQALADKVRDALERQNISCWIAPRDIPAGQSWATGIVEGVRRCHTFVLILSSKTQRSRQIPRELELADGINLPIIAFRIEDVQPPPDLIYFLGNVQWVDAFNEQFEAGLARLAASVTSGSLYPASPTRIHLQTPANPSRSGSIYKRYHRVLQIAAMALLAAGIGSGTYLKFKDIQAHAEYREGEEYFQLGELRSALSEFTIAINADPKYYNAYCERARVYEALGNKEKAQQDLRRAISLFPNRPFALALRDQFNGTPGPEVARR